MLSRRKFIKQSSLGLSFAMMPTCFNFFELNDFVKRIFFKKNSRRFCQFSSI